MYKIKKYFMTKKLKNMCNIMLLRWYLEKSWGPFFIFLIFSFLFYLISHFFLFQERDFIDKYELFFNILFYVYLFQIPLAFLIMITHMVRKEFRKACYEFLFLLPMCLISFFVIVFYSFAFMFLDIDHFAENLKIPAHIELHEPENTGFSLHDHFRTSHYSFQDQVLDALDSGINLNTFNLKIPSLETLLATQNTKTRLFVYLAKNPEWHFYKDPKKGDCALRMFTVKGKPQKTSGNYYSNLFSEPYFQYQLSISFAENQKVEPLAQCQELKNSKGETIYYYLTAFPVAHAVVRINEQCKIMGAKMTAKTIDLLEKEFASLLDSDVLPPLIKSPTNGTTFNLLREQGGVYRSEIWCNPLEAGAIYLKAFEITKNTPLSKKRLYENSLVYTGYSQDPKQLFYNQVDFTIFEGNWEQFYAARFELWFKPQSGAPDRLLLKKNYKIDGWMR